MVANPFRCSNANSAGLQTLRYVGFPEFVKVLVDTGFLSDEKRSFLKEPMAWKTATQKILGASSSSERDLSWAISSKTTFKDNDEKYRLMAGLKWSKQPRASLFTGYLRCKGPRCTLTCAWDVVSAV